MLSSEFTTGNIRAVECFKEAWEIIKDQYWLLFAICLVGILISGILLYIPLGAMMCGIYLCFFRKLDGEEVQIDTLFKGFEFLLQGFLLFLIIAFPMFIFFILTYGSMIALVISGQKLSEDQIWAYLGGALILEFIFAVLMTCYHTLLIFAFPLMADRKLSAWQASITSVRAVRANLKGVAGLFGVAFLINLAGVMLFCVGTYLTIPIIIAGTVVAYRKVFPKQGDSQFNPPPPTPFQGTGNRY